MRRTHTAYGFEELVAPQHTRQAEPRSPGGRRSQISNGTDMHKYRKHPWDADFEVHDLDWFDSGMAAYGIHRQGKSGGGLLSKTGGVEPYRCKAHSLDSGEGASDTKQEYAGCISSHPQQQIVGAAPCADGLVWSFGGQDFSRVTKPTDKPPNTLWAVEPFPSEIRESNDTRVGAALAPVSTAVSTRFDKVDDSFQSSKSLIMSAAPNLTLSTCKNGSSEGEETDTQRQRVPGTFSTIDERLEQGEEEMTTTTTDEREGFSILRHEADAPESDTRPYRHTKSNSGRGSNNDDLSPPLLPESISTGHDTGDDTAGGLVGVSPRSGQESYAEKFRSPWSHSQQSAMLAVDESVGSVFDETSPARSKGGRDGSFSPCAVSIRTTSSLCAGEEGKETTSRGIGAWGEGDRERKEEGRAGQGGYELDEEEESEGNGRQHHAYHPLGEEEQGDGVGATLRAAAAADHAQALSFVESTGSATSLLLGMSAESRGGGTPTSETSGTSWDADDTPRLDDYFRGQAAVPTPEGQILLAPFGGGANGSPLFPSPPLESKAIYGLRTWSFGSDSCGGGNSSEKAFFGPSAASPSAGGQQNRFGDTQIPAQAFAFQGSPTSVEANDIRRGGQQQHRHHERQQREERKSPGASTAGVAAGAVRGNALPRRGRTLVQTTQDHNEHHGQKQHPKRAAEVGDEEDRVKRNFNSNNINNNSGNVGCVVRRREREGARSCMWGGGHQRRHQEWLDRFGEEKRMERQEEEAKAQRREAARRRTRDLLLERAKQRLFAVAASAASATATAAPAPSFSKSAIIGAPGTAISNPCSLAAGSDRKRLKSSEAGQDNDCGSDKDSAIPGACARGDGGQGKAKAEAVTSSSCKGGDEASAATAVGVFSAGVPLYAQETWAARRSKVERKSLEKDITPEEKEKLEKEKFERIAATRRRQKENHKRFLAALKAKRVQEEEDRLLHQRKEAEKRCNVKMWAERRLQKMQKLSSGGCSEHHPAVAVAVAHNSAGGGDGREGAPDGAGRGGTARNVAGGVAGSGLNAIRKAHSRNDKQGGGNEDALGEKGSVDSTSSSTSAVKANPATDEELEKAAEKADAMEREERRRRSLEVKQAREKAQRHLENLTRKKREKEDEEENTRRRQARRMRLLRDKVLCMAKELRNSGKGVEAAQTSTAGAESSEEDRHGNGKAARAARLTDDELQASVERLTQQRKGGEIVTASARDFNDWKRKHRVSPETKVFVMTGWYPCVKKALLERGWAQNPDRDSPFFDLKWTLHSQDIRTTDIEPWQLCNHFFKNVAITTKAGLLGNLRNLKWFADCDCSEILPRGYDLSVDTDVLAFLDDFCATAAESLLKHVLLRAKGRVALRCLSWSAAKPLAGGATSQLSPTRAREGHGGESTRGDVATGSNGTVFSLGHENEERDRDDPVRKAAPKSSPRITDDEKSEDCYDDGDDAFDDSSVDEIDGDDKQPIPPPVARPSSAPKVSPVTTPVATFKSSNVTHTDRVVEKIVDSAGAVNMLPRPSASCGKTGEHRQKQQQQQQQQERQRQQQMEQNPEASSLPPPAHTGTATAPMSEAQLRTAITKESGGENRQEDRDSTPGQGCPAHQAGTGKDGDNDRDRKPRKQAPPISARRRQWEPEGVGIEVNAEILRAALAVCRRRYAYAGEGEGGVDLGCSTEAVCSELEWELIGLGTGGGAPHPDMPGLYRPHSLPSRPATPLEVFIQSQNEKEASSTNNTRGERRRQKQQKQQDDLRARCADRVRTVVPLGQTMLDEVEAVLKNAAEDLRSQFDLNGDFSQNMWIVKPAAKSRGRGIECFTELDKLLSYTESKQPQAVSQWVVHKYIENPLIIARRKFDMRQWVLVTDWNPLTVWFYDRCYVRFGVEEYTTSGSNIGNSFVHLVNNSICKKSNNFGKVSTTDNGIEVHEHMWSNEVFTAYVDEMAGEGCWRKKMQPRMEQIVTWSLLCAQDLVEHRKKSWELYGYDFMVDDQYKPWLIEINSSPACDYSTKVTEQYVQAALADLLKVTIDLPEWEAKQKKTKWSQAQVIPSSSSPEPQRQRQQQQQREQQVAMEEVAAATFFERQKQASTPPTSAQKPITASPEGMTSRATPSADGGSGQAIEQKVEAGLGSEEKCGIDDEENREEGGAQAHGGGKPPDTGLWRLLYKGAFVPFPVASFGTDLALKGTRIANNKRARSSPHTVKL